jgi:uncharacterized Zn finger protein (UPF0148 family)
VKPSKTKTESKNPCPACGVEGFAKGGKCSVCGHEASKTTKAKKAKATESNPAEAELGKHSATLGSRHSSLSKNEGI